MFSWVQGLIMSQATLPAHSQRKKKKKEKLYLQVKGKIIIISQTYLFQYVALKDTT